MKNKVITLALAAANTLKYGLLTIFQSKDGSKKSIQVHKAIARYMLERFKQMSMWLDGRQISVKWSSDLRQTTLHAHFKLISFLFHALVIFFGR